MNEWEDYFQILQIHFMAEPEVIKGAYIRLCKKYHPDTNPSEGAELRIRKINTAYEVLSDPILRKQYLVKWFERHHISDDTVPIKHRRSPLVHFSTEPCNTLMNAYLAAISSRKYQEAYDLLSEIDRKNIQLRDYIKWQTLVAEVFELQSYQCTVENVFSEAEVNEIKYILIAQIRVKVTEKNHVMERIEKDEFVKNIVFEDNEWHVFLGYKDLNTITKRFDQLAHLRKKKSYLSDPVSSSQSLHYYSRREFLVQAEKEQERLNRYGNTFSMILLSSRTDELSSLTKGLHHILRKLDIPCRWKPDQFLVLLPETNEAGAISVVKKIVKWLKEENSGCQYSICSMEQKHQTIKSLIHSIQSKSKE